MFLFWGPDHILFYNDAYIPALELTHMHPFALGKKGEDVWKGSWSFIEPEIDAVMQGENDEFSEEVLHRLERTFEDIHLTCHLNPIKSSEGKIEGILILCNETISIAARQQLQTQKKLEQLNKEITHLFNSINEGFYSRDILKNEYITLSAGCPKIYGYTIEEFFENPMLWAKVIHPDDKERVFKDDIHLKAGKQTLTEYRINHPDGDIRWIEVKAIPTLTNGKLTRVDGIVNDITARKLAEIEIIKQKEFSESIVNSLPGIFYFYDESGKFIRWNKNFELVSEYSADEVAQMHPLDFFGGDEKKLLKNKIEEAFRTGESDVEAHFVTKSGKRIPYFFTGRTIKYEETNCLLGTAIDISKRVEIEGILQKSEAMLSNILNLIPQTIFWKDKESRILGGNKVFSQVAGMPINEAIGKNDFELPWDEGETLKYRADDQEVMRTNKAKLHVIESQRQVDGSILWLDTSKIPLTDANGEVYGVLGISEDITERKKAEEERERLTLDLIEKNVNLKQFSYIVSHNLRSPINKILGLGSLLKMPQQPDDHNYRMMEYIVNEAQNLNNVVKDLTTIISFQDIGVNVKEDIIIYDEIKLIKNAIENEIVESEGVLKCDFSAINKFRSVKGYFYSIAYNLITNAIKYRDPQRQLNVEIRTSVVNNQLCFQVSDNGLGIDLERHGKEVFGLYNRFHSKDIPGKGMGLNLIKTQTETLGGKVELDSKPGIGTTFRIYFPLD